MTTPTLPSALAALALPAFALASLVGATPAFAGTRACSDHDALQARLAEGWGEQRQSIGLGADGAVVEVFASADTGTWTIAVTSPGGPSCIVAAGEHFESLDEPLPPAGEGA